MRVAVLADIHANAPALRAVLAQLDSEQPTRSSSPATSLVGRS